MKVPLLLLCLSVILTAGVVDDRIQQMQKRNEGTAKGFLLQQRLLHPDELEALADKTPEPTPETIPEPVPESPHPGVSHEVFYEKVIELNTKITRLESTIEQLTKITENIQISTINNKEFVLKLIEILLTALLGGGGIIGGLVFRKKVKKG